MRITSRGFAAVTAGLVSAVVLAGCSSNSTKPTVLPSLLTTPATTSSAAQTPPATSAAARPSTSSGIESPTIAASTKPNSATATKPPVASTGELAAAVQSYFAKAAASIKSASELPKFRSMFTSSCGQCATDYGNYKKLHDNHRTAVGGAYEILSVKATGQSQTFGSATIVFKVQADTIADQSGKIIERDPAQPKQSAGLTLTKAKGSWVVVGYIDFGPVK